MITAIIELVKTGFSFFQKKQEKEVNVELEKNKETNETNREDIKKNGWSARSILMVVLASILFFAYVIGPLVDGFLGVPLFHEALEPIFKLLMALIVGS
ncbi:TPA: hypothetical protein SMH10_001425 [Klebsiella oxytoca]|uniref:hypothetical protein n=1 Tax=Klebsiella oxytoca TaxID=571 RepID=UPI0019570ED4|nr:hypothetical protein [Klebsiella oxytoca]QRS58066.1 hypothetical protein I6K62_14195 [Klebsiella oxytoca]HEJ7614009.1 hypothetical protein [Klebsiella oxytoca]HEJ8737019.1 hypothetical protein [Klebsiella oxytoca]